MRPHLIAVAVLALLSGACSGESEGRLNANGDGGAATVPATTLAPGTPYAPAARPAMTGATGALDASWIDAASGEVGAIPDGIYWGVTQPGNITDVVTFDLTQAYFGEFCVAHFGDTAADDCANDYGVVADPHGLLVVPAEQLDVVSVADAATQKNYAIDGSELARLIAGAPPAATAPAGYSYVAFPFAITITGGAIVSATQIWLP
jgi:hypothetical protein